MVNSLNPLEWNEDVIHRIKETENMHKSENNEETFRNLGNPEDEIR